MNIINLQKMIQSQGRINCNCICNNCISLDKTYITFQAKYYYCNCDAKIPDNDFLSHNQISLTHKTLPANLSINYKNKSLIYGLCYIELWLYDF